MSKGGMVCIVVAFIPALLLALPQESPAQSEDYNPVRLTSGKSVETHPIVAWGDHGFGVVWFKGNELRYTLLDENCQQSKKPITIYSGWQLDDKNADIAYREDYFYVVFLDYDQYKQQVWLQRVHYDYTLSGSAEQLTFSSINHTYPRLVWSGKEFGLLYIIAYAGDTGRDLCFQCYDCEFNPIGEPTLITRAYNNLYFCDLVWSGNYWGVAWVHNDKYIYFQRLKRNGRMKGNMQGVFVSPDTQIPKDVDLEPGDKGGYAVVFRWKANDTSPAQIYAQILRKNGKRNGPLRQVSNATVAASTPSITWDAPRKQYGVFWSDERSNDIAIRASLLDRKGVVLKGDGQMTQTTAKDYDPKVVNNGDVAMLVFAAYKGLKADVYALSMICEDW
jgi:hypothetical protein